MGGVVPESMEKDSTDKMRALEKRRDDLADWLEESAPEMVEEQRHLDAGTEARAYWHYGYLLAIKDVLRFMGGDQAVLH